MEGNCPNCGYPLISYRTDRQPAGRREVILKWSLCTRCRHVALQSWSFGDPSEADEPELVTEQRSGRAAPFPPSIRRAAG